MKTMILLLLSFSFALTVGAEPLDQRTGEPGPTRIGGPETARSTSGQPVSYDERARRMVHDRIIREHGRPEYDRDGRPENEAARLMRPSEMRLYQERVWTADDGGTVRASFKGASPDGLTITLAVPDNRPGRPDREYRVSYSRFSIEDQLFIISENTRVIEVRQRRNEMMQQARQAISATVQAQERERAIAAAQEQERREQRRLDRLQQRVDDLEFMQNHPEVDAVP